MSNVLVIGTGGCGNKLLESFLTILDESVGLQSTYDGLFINSNVNEMNRLPHFNPIINGLCINGGGTGRNPEKARESIELDNSKLFNYFVSKLPNYDTVYICSSADGGFGSGSLPIIADRINQIDPDININLLIAVPKISSRKASLENTLDLYEEILRMVKTDNEDENDDFIRTINSVQFINNEKMVDEDVFNELVMELFLDSIELGNGALDPNDAKIINSAYGYKVSLKLDNKFKDTKSAIDDSIKNSPFVLPVNYQCTHMGAVFNEDDFNVNTLNAIYNPKVLDKVDYGDNNIIVLGGCNMPNTHMNLYQEALKNLENEDNLKKDTENEVEFKSRTKSIKKEKFVEEVVAITEDESPSVKSNTASRKRSQKELIEMMKNRKKR